MRLRLTKRQDEEEVLFVQHNPRIARLGTDDLVSWAENQLYDIGRALSDWHNYGVEERLLDAVKATQTLNDIVNEVHTRQSVD